MPERAARDVIADRRGTALIEFAMLAPLFIGLMLAILHTSVVLFTQELLQSAAETAARRVATGAPQKARTSADEFRRALCVELPSYLACDRLAIDIRHAATLTELLRSSSPMAVTNGVISTPTKYEAGGPSTFNMVRLGYVWSVVGSSLSLDLSNAGPGHRLIETTTIVKVEPYNP